MPFFHFVENVHGVVGIHFRDEARGVVGIHVFQNVARDFFVEFRQGFGGFFGGQVREHAQLFIQRKLFQMFGSVGGVDEVVAVDVAPAEFQSRFLGTSFVEGKIFVFVVGGLCWRRGLFFGRGRGVRRRSGRHAVDVFGFLWGSGTFERFGGHLLPGGFARFFCRIRVFNGNLRGGGIKFDVC